jgi:hypothetical protein
MLLRRLAAVFLVASTVILGNGSNALADSAKTTATPANPWFTIAAGTPDAAPNCGKGVGPRKIAAKYKAKRHNKGVYRTDILYCGGAKYGYRHLQKHVPQYFGGWGNFSFSIGAVLKKPADWVVQDNGNFRESAPIFQCFFAGYYFIWTFYVVPNIGSGSIVTAYGSKGRRVNTPCP